MIYNIPVLGGYYRHYKDKDKAKPYKVIDIVLHSESLESLVLYQALYNNELGTMWVRPLKMFGENVTFAGKSVPRFVLETPTVVFKYYHTHIYFSREQAARAAELSEKMKRDLGGKVQVHALQHEPIGPHPQPMFEADFLGQEYLMLVNWLIVNREDFKILIHPLSGDAMADHTIYAQFLGAKVDLKLEILKNHSMAAMTSAPLS